MNNEYGKYQVGDKLLFVEFPFKAAVEVLEKYYTEKDGYPAVLFKIRFTKIYRQYSADQMREAGYECTVGRNLNFTGAACGLWRFLPLDDAMEQAIMEHQEKNRLARKAKE